MQKVSYWSSPGLRYLQESLLLAERSISLVASFSPVNFESEVERLVAAYDVKGMLLPRFHYAAPERLRVRLNEASAVLLSAQRAVAAFASETRGRGFLIVSQLLDDRIRELMLELELVRFREDKRVVSLARRRYVFSKHELSQADTLAQTWLSQGYGESPEGDDRAPLAQQLSVFSVESSLSIPILERDIAAKAAVGEDCLYTRRGLCVSSREARRLWIHEVEGHLLPRLRARAEDPPFAIGTSGCAEDEEGRAVLLEERSGTMDSCRRYQLALRYSLASAFRQEDGSHHGLTHSLIAQGAPLRVVLTELCRILRGGGLAREIVYLPAYLRVRSALIDDPSLEEWMERGRVSVKGAGLLSEL